MARALLVGCGCCARRAGQMLLAAGWEVRGTTRDPSRLEAIAAAGIEPVCVDPDRVGEIVAQLADVTAVAWLLAAAEGDAKALEVLDAQRLPSLLERVVDSPVRGFVFEAGPARGSEGRAAGRRAVEDAAERWRIPVEVVAAGRSDPERWATAVSGAVAASIGLG